MSDANYAKVVLRLLAAKAEKLEKDLSNHKLWEGDYDRAVSELTQIVHDLPRSVR